MPQLVSIFDVPVDVTPTPATPPAFIIYAHRDAVPHAEPAVYFAWSERGAFRLVHVTARSWHEARAKGAALLGELVENCDAARELNLEPRFGRTA